MSIRASLSARPDCRATVRTADVLIEYEPASSEPTGYAECPRCRAVVEVPL